MGSVSTFGGTFLQHVKRVQGFALLAILKVGREHDLSWASWAWDLVF